MNEQVQQVQRKLIQKGFNVGEAGADGIWGPMTRAAWNRWQAATKLTPTVTLLASDVALLLGAMVAPPQQILHMNEALRLLGLREGVGKANNPVILDWADDLDIHYKGDDIAWCGLFLAHTQRTAYPDEPLPSNPLGARAYGKFGVDCKPQLGAVATFWRGSKDGWQGHVGYLAGESASTYIVLGGNQSDAVTYTNIAKNRLLTTRWPRTAGAPPNLPLPSKPAGRLSTNEA